MQISVIPSGAARSGAVYGAIGSAVGGPFLRLLQQERSLHYASLRESPAGMTVLFAICKCAGADRGTSTASSVVLSKVAK